MSRGGVIALALLLVAGSAHAFDPCERAVVSGYAKHADRSHHYRSLTTGSGCEWAWKDWRAGFTAFLNSNTRRTLLVAGAYLPLHYGPFSAGASFGDAMFGYDKQHQLAGGLTVEAMGAAYGGDATLIPRVDGMDGAVLWLRFKCVRAACEPLK